MSTLSGRKSYPRRPYTNNAISRPHSFPRPHHSIYTGNCNCLASVLDKQKGFRTRSAGDLTPKGPKAAHRSSACSSPSIGCRRTPPAVSPRRSRRGIAKRQERPCRRSIPLRSKISVKENASTQADASAATLSESASGISFQVSVRKHDDVYQTNDAPSNERIKQESEDDNPPSLHDDDKQLSLSPSLPETEYQANLLAAAEDSRYLFEEYYKRTHGDSKNEADDAADTYWRWDVERQQWFHTDTGTQSVVWFMG